MPTTFDAEFKQLSLESQRHLRAGMLDYYTYDLKSMAALFGREKKYTDKLKVLMIAFHIDLSGVCQEPFIDDAVISGMKTAIGKTAMNKYQVDELFLMTIRNDTTPRHLMKVGDSLYLLQLCLQEKKEYANTLLKKMVEKNMTKLS